MVLPPEEAVERLRSHGASVATAESLTGGALCAALVSMPGASDTVRGGIVAYTVAMKARLLGVDPELIDRAGVVSEEVALAMADGVRAATGAAVGMATTGVAGPEPHGGLPPGRVCVAVVGPAGSCAATLDLEGSREVVSAGTVAEALALLGRGLDGTFTLL